MWWWIWVAGKYPIAIGVKPPSLQEDERDIGHGGARLRASTNSDLPDASASMPRLVTTNTLTHCATAPTSTRISKSYAIPNIIPAHARAMGAGVGSTVGDPI